MLGFNCFLLCFASHNMRSVCVDSRPPAEQLGAGDPAAAMCAARAAVLRRRGQQPWYASVLTSFSRLGLLPGLLATPHLTHGSSAAALSSRRPAEQLGGWGPRRRNVQRCSGGRHSSSLGTLLFWLLSDGSDGSGYYPGYYSAGRCLRIIALRIEEQGTAHAT